MARTKQEVAVVRPDRLEDIAQSDLVQVSRKLLNAVIKSTDATKPKKVDAERLKELRMVLGFLRATDGVIKSKLTYYKMTGVVDKLSAVSARAKKLKSA